MAECRGGEEQCEDCDGLEDEHDGLLFGGGRFVEVGMLVEGIEGFRLRILIEVEVEGCLGVKGR